MQELPLLFLDLNSNSDIASKFERYEEEIIHVDLDELNQKVSEEPFQCVVVCNPTKKQWEPWAKKNPDVSLIQFNSKKRNLQSLGFIEWLNYDIEDGEFNFRLRKAHDLHLLLTQKRKQERKHIRERDIQNQMNDRLLSVSLELKQAKEKIEQLSLTDALTGLGNRRLFNDEALKEIHKAERYETHLCLLVLDIDNFKRINDTLGHQSGDDVLKKLGSLIHDSLRDTDWAARYGGEEFCVVLPMTSEAGALKVAERLRKKIEVNLGVDFKQTFTTSIGLSKFEKGLNLEKWFDHADKALYHSKQTGKNKVTYFSTQTKECCEYSSGRAQPNFKRI